MQIKNKDNGQLRIPHKPYIRHMTSMIRTGALIAFSFAFILLGACGTQNESTTPLHIEATPSAASSPAATPSPTPAATTPPEETPTQMPSPTPKPTQAIEMVGQAVCTAKDSVNIREKADKDSSVLGTLLAGNTVDVMTYEDGWARVSYNGIEGYVSRDYLMGRHTPLIEVPMGEWAMILVNPSHLLPDDFEVTLADFEGGQVDARILDICKEMFSDAAADGVTFELVDAYRSFDRQNELYTKKVDSYVAKGYSREEAEVQAATITARPNTSEHQTGLALDIVTPSYTKRDKGFANTDAFKWLFANAQDYGFTMRYKQDKQQYTKVIYEPWHWRFVGVEAARAMKQSGECFEEYLDVLE
jgi:D-alanyl-D-alanine carboxypeptidase